MRRPKLWAAAATALTLVAPCAVAQVPGGAPAAARFQYDELTLQVPAGQPPPGPDAFQQRYAQALEHFATSASLASLQADAGARRDAALKALHEPDAGERIAGMLTGQVTDLISRANPIAGMLFGMLMAAARTHGGSDVAAAEGAAREGEAKYRAEANWRPTLRRISVWDRWLRVDDLDDGSAVIHKPDVGEYLVLDTRQKTWVRLGSAPVDEVARRIAADPQRCTYALHRDTTRIGARGIDGREAEGYRSVERNPTGNGATLVLEYTTWVSGQRIPADILDVMHGFPACPPDSPAARSETVPDDRVTPYEAVLSRFEDAAGKALPRPAGSDDTPDQVTFEQHLRALTDADRERLFAVPADYRELR